MKKTARQSLPELVDSLLAEHEEWNARAEQAISEYLDLIAVSGVPRASLRACEIDSRANGYSRATALRNLRAKLEN